MLTKMQSIITEAHLKKAMDYAQYRKLIEDLLEQNKATSEIKAEGIDILHYTKMNVQRMNRWDKTAKISEEVQNAVKAIEQAQIWLILTEGWCGDAAQNIPAIVKIAALNPLIEVKFLLRDENIELIDAYLTDGGRSIPKLISLKKDGLEEMGTWGPRPAKVQAMMLEYKKNPTVSFAEFAENLHKWYADNKNEELQQEFLALLKAWK